MTIYNLLFTASIIAAPLHAMKNVHIVPFDLEKHGPETQQLFMKSFYSRKPDSALVEPIKNPNTQVAVLQKDSTKHPSKVIGFAIWEHENIYIHEAFSDISNDKHSKTMLDVCRVHFLAIARHYRKTKKKLGKGFGRKLLNHIEQRAKDHNDDIVALKSVPHTTGFYDKHGYIKTMPHNNVHLRAKPLSEDVSMILNQYISQRAQANPLTDRHDHIQI